MRHDESDIRLLAREHSDDCGPPPDLAVEPLKAVGRTDPSGIEHGEIVEAQ